MLTVSINKLVESIMEAEAFRLPDMSEGTEYLYNKLYRRLAHGEDTRLSELDFGAFTDDDITALNILHADTFEKSALTAGSIKSELRKITPMYAPAVFV